MLHLTASTLYLIMKKNSRCLSPKQWDLLIIKASATNKERNEKKMLQTEVKLQFIIKEPSSRERRKKYEEGI